mgnify:CR=1 FL=1
MSAADDQSRYDVSGDWQGDNQAWWDWYVSLAYNADTPKTRTPAAPPAAAPLDLAALEEEMSEPYPVSEAEITAFQRDGYIKLKQVLSPGAVTLLRLTLAKRLGAAFDTTLDGGADGRFLSEEMAWLDDPVLRAFTLSPRIAGICGALLGVEAMRLYHDNLLSKEPGCGRTPWHYDDHHFPLNTHDVVTAWIPAQAIPRAMGPLAFAKPIDVYKHVVDVPFDKTDDSYDRQVAEIFRRLGVAVDDGPFEEGEVSFHHNLSFHTAGPNASTLSRMVLANTYFVDGARVVDEPTLVSGDWRKFIPGVEPGEIADSALNPVCWSLKKDRS